MKQTSVEEFNKIFNVEGPLKRTELEEALLEEYNDISYRKFDPGEYYGGKRYHLGIEADWGEYNYVTSHTSDCKSMEEALINVLCGYKEQFYTLVRRVYGKTND